MSRDVYIIVGPTASGKTTFAATLAQKIAAEIITCDSTTIYQGFDIGTAKPSQKQRSEVQHHLIDICHWSEEFDAGKYAKLANEKIADVRSRGKKIVIVGGTGLYLRALLGEKFHDLPSDKKLKESLEKLSNADLLIKLSELDPKRGASLHPNDRYRLVRAVEVAMLTGKTLEQNILENNHSVPRVNFFMIYLDPFLQEAKKLVQDRTTQMLNQGFIEEVKSLRRQGCPSEHKIMQSVGYHEVNLYLDQKLSLDDLPQKIHESTNQYARRQRTWFSSLPVNLQIVGTSFNALKFLENCLDF